MDQTNEDSRLELASEYNKNEILERLKKIEGQIKGVQKMISEQKSCTDIMIQISAVRAAINKVGGLIMENYINECLRKNLKTTSSKDEIDLVIETIIKYLK